MKLRKSIILVGTIVFLLLPLTAEPIYNKLQIGMPLDQMNKLDLGTRLNAQDYQSVLTSYGIVKIDTESSKQYFPLYSHVWEGVKVELKNNLLRAYVLQSQSSLKKNEFKSIFSNLIEQYGTEFQVSTFQSFYEKGHRVVWYTSNERVALRVVLQRNQKCRVSIKKSEWILNEPQQYTSIQDAFLVLEPILGKEYRLNPVQLAGN